MRTSILLAIAAMSLLSTGCSLVVDFEQCTQASDCASGICGSDGICEEVPTCTKKSDCAALGSEAYCLARSCKVIDRTICPQLLPAAVFEGDENILPIGGLMPLTGSESDNGEGTIQGAKVALETINKVGVSGAKFGLIVCDTVYQPDKAVTAATYLTDELEVRAAVGAISSAETIAVTQSVSREKGLLLVSPSSTSPAITNLPDDDLLWRTIGSDDLQAAEMAALVDNLGKARVAVLAVNDAYGDGFLDKLNAFWTQSGRDITDADTFRTIRYESGVMLDTTTLSAIGEPLFGDGGLKPDAIVVVGAADAQSIIKGLEGAYIDSLPADEKPAWVLSEGGKKTGLLMSDFMGTWDRIIGTDIGKPKSSLYASFTTAYAASSGLDADNYTFASKAHDAAFLIAIAFGSQSDPFAATAAALAGSLKLVSTGEKAEATTSGFTLAISKISQGASVDFVGASGEVDLDPETGDNLQENYVYWSIDASGGSAEFGEYMVPAPE